MEPILTIEDLHISFEVERQTVTAVDGVNLTFRRARLSVWWMKAVLLKASPR